MTSTAIHVGGCMCGAVRFQADGEPLRVGLCHCLTCRRETGAPFGAFVIFPRDRFRVTAGKTSSYASSAELSRHFCPACGSPVFSEEPDEISVYLGALDHAEAHLPTYELFAIRRLPWVQPLEGIASFARLREGG
jgi:hypothetical protein